MAPSQPDMLDRIGVSETVSNAFAEHPKLASTVVSEGASLGHKRGGGELVDVRMFDSGAHIAKRSVSTWHLVAMTAHHDELLAVCRLLGTPRRHCGNIVEPLADRSRIDLRFVAHSELTPA